MLKRSLLATAITAVTMASANAAPFLPMDARGLAMGNTGVASAKRAHAPAYNPSLLSQADNSDDFAILLPQVGVNIADEDEMYDTFTTINDDLVPQLEDLMDENTVGNFNDNLQSLSDAADALDSAISSLGDVTDLNSATAKISEIRSRNQDVKDALSAVTSDLTSVDNLTADLTNQLNSVSGSPLSGRLGTSAAIAFPGKKFAAAISVSGTATFSGRAFFTAEDSALLNGYADAGLAYAQSAEQLTTDLDTLLDNAETGSVTSDQLTAIQSQASDTAGFTSDTITTAAGDISIIDNGVLSADAEDAQMNSNLEVIAVAVADVGLSFSREFTFWDKKVAIGLTPKLQKVITYHYAAQADYEGDIDEQDIEDTSETYTGFNVDLGASFRFGETNKWVVGLVGKNLISKSYDVQAAEIKGSDPLNPSYTGATTVSLNPQYRAGLAFDGEWTTVALDVDLVENDPIAWENPTQYAAIGAEFDVWNTVQFRLGYRTNMAASDAEVASVGLGFSPFGLHIDIAAMANPNKVEKEAGVAAEFGLYF
ncbi:conjugal transfer protein TraF [Oceanobacter mangrovi]|uniref:conjugal transfer protein TraF n=1 Tax=Oceanobacter mangrovi TaxID=2862510 RepID=UPI001C8DDC6A|nr:conjugal transfer protein TraF [Oceanobacter mangrovi]